MAWAPYWVTTLFSMKWRLDFGLNIEVWIYIKESDVRMKLTSEGCANVVAPLHNFALDLNKLQG